jgi:hypothetical protein
MSVMFCFEALKAGQCLGIFDAFFVSRMACTQALKNPSFCYNVFEISFYLTA